MVAMVTGGASGLGRATVERFVQEGAKVTVCDISRSNGETVVKELGSDAIFVRCDVSSEEDVKVALALCKRNFKKLDILVNCAGIGNLISVYNPSTKIVHSLDQFIKIQEVNLIGTFNTIRLAAPIFAENVPSDEDGQRGVVVNTTSIAAFDGTPGNSAYAASKGGIVAMTLPIARDLATIGVRNVTIAPGLFDTPLYGVLPEQTRAVLESKVPFPKRLGKPDEFAQIVQAVVLNRMFNGETIRVDASLRIC